MFFKGFCSLLPDLHSPCSESGGKMIQKRRNHAHKRDHQRPASVFVCVTSALAACPLNCVLLQTPGVSSRPSVPDGPAHIPHPSNPAPRACHRRTGTSLKQAARRTFTQVSKQSLESVRCCLSVHVCRSSFINQTLKHNNTCRVNVCRRS